MDEKNRCFECNGYHKPDMPHQSPRASRIAVRLREIHKRDGAPSTREVAARTDGRVSHTTVAKVLDGTFPRLSTLLDIAIALGATRTELAELQGMWEERNEKREKIRSEIRQRSRRRTLQGPLPEGVVIHPGDTIIFALNGEPSAEPRGLEDLQKQLEFLFPDNQVTVISGATVSVVRATRTEVAA